MESDEIRAALGALLLVIDVLSRQRVIDAGLFRDSFLAAAVNAPPNVAQALRRLADAIPQPGAPQRGWVTRFLEKRGANDDGR